MDLRTKLLSLILVFLVMPSHGLAEPVLTFGTEPDPIGALECDLRLTDVLTLTATANEDSDNTYVLRIVMYTDVGSSSEDSCLCGLSHCPQTVLNVSSACGCIAESSQDEASFSTTLNAGIAGLNPTGTGGVNDLVGFLCESDRTVKFRADLIGVEPADGSLEVAAEDASSDAITLIIDVTAPQAPSAPPSVRAAEGALVIKLDSSDQNNDDVESHEVCVQVASNTNAQNQPTEEDGGPLTLEELRGGFAATSCKKTSQLNSGEEYRYEGLTNDIEYVVVVAAFDQAGNRSGNGESVTASPSALLDFAELYTARLGGAAGETGGCTSMESNHTAPLTVLWLLLGFYALTKRSRQ
ncbi:MAG: hypothetical protein VYA30_13340 [Myxococcota bacterium]|nr:hypothetical protein [Myxococcota bacterium]